MFLQSRLLSETVPLVANDHVLILNSAADPFVSDALSQVSTGTILLAEDNIAAIQAYVTAETSHVRTTAFHDYMLHYPAATIDVAVMNLLYQPANTWIHYGLQVAFHALKPGACLYVIGAKERGILTIARRMRELFGNVETLTISKGFRVVRSCQSKTPPPITQPVPTLSIFAHSTLDEGTQLLLQSLKVSTADTALDIGCGAGFIGLHIARQAQQGYVTMVDASLAAVEAAQQAIEQSKLTNICVLPSDGARAVLSQCFDLVVTNPPFHQGGLQTTAIAERFIREAAQILHPRGRFYLVANRFLKYEPTLRACFQDVQEVAGNSRYKVLRAHC